MSRAQGYRQALKGLTDWTPFLLRESHLPGPRGNLELAQAVADEGNEALFRSLIAYDPERAPTGTPQEFLAFCGVLGLGTLLAGGRWDVLPILRQHASDPRWRLREAVAMALQRFGRADTDGLIAEMRAWSKGSLLEKRAAAAALCEPDLLCERRHAAQALEIHDEITVDVTETGDRRSADFKVLRKALGYCWSVATVALPEQGKALMEKWLGSDDPDIRWIMRENLRKNRLLRMDREWVAVWTKRVSS